MNKRFKELAEQAGFQYIKDEGIGWAGNYNASLPKFAELIVRDCMDVVGGYTKPRTFETHYDAVEQIEALFGIKHFGVE
jgi:hypothetical protein